MCDPLTIATLAIGAAGTAANTIGRAGAAKKQEAEYNRWRQYQDKQRALEEERQEGFRKKAEGEVNESIGLLGAENQTDIQTTEAGRLEDLYSTESGAAAPTAVADEAMLSGQQSGGEVFQTDMARALSDATASAKSRLGALATMRSFGGSAGGLGTVIPIAQNETAQAINQQNNYRSGSLNTYGLAQRVEPVQVSYSNPIADVAQQFLGAGMAGLGKTFAGAITPGATAAAQTLPAVGPIPPPRPLF